MTKNEAIGLAQYATRKITETLELNILFSRDQFAIDEYKIMVQNYQQAIAILEILKDKDDF